MSLSKIILHKGKEASFLRKHHWLFSGAIKSGLDQCAPGDWVEITDHSGKPLGTGYINGGSIAVKTVGFNLYDPEEAIYNALEKAIKLRRLLGFLNNTKTNCFRLINAEGDGLPGLIADIYDRALILQLHHKAYENKVDFILEKTEAILGNKFDTVLLKLPAQSKEKEISRFLRGNDEEGIVLENGIKFLVNWSKGQKTGFFLDQRNNRALVGTLSQGKKILNTFSYTGGFSMYALANGAIRADSIDISPWAVEMAEKNAALNEFPSEKHHGIAKDVVQHLKEFGKEYDMIILDPPAFAKSLSARHNALMAYKRINLEALKMIQPGGLLFSFSCSQVVDKFMFRQTILSAAIEAQREVKIIHQLSQPEDHPVNIFHPESEYLKGFVLMAL